jgi:hypothetical protein
MPDELATVVFMKDAAGADRLGEGTATVAALFAPTAAVAAGAAAADELATDGNAPVPATGIPTRQTSTPATRVRTRPFKLLTS